MKIARNTRSKRMTADERKQSILRAAAPIIARSGFRGTSVRAIALAAGVSEALLYKHFPSKQALYLEAAAEARESSRFTIARFATLKPSSESFVLLTYATIHFILFGFPGSEAHERSAERLVFRSLLDDGHHARAVFADTAAAWMGYVVESYDAAVVAGDIVELAIETQHRFRFVQQLGMALRLSHLPPQPAFDYAGTKRDLADQAVLFSLRGVGLTDAAIARYFHPKRLRSMLDTLFQGDKPYSCHKR
jgi:AcrR family transcriptional regulator